MGPPKFIPPGTYLTAKYVWTPSENLTTFWKWNIVDFGSWNIFHLQNFEHAATYLGGFLGFLETTHVWQFSSTYIMYCSLIPIHTQHLFPHTLCKFVFCTVQMCCEAAEAYSWKPVNFLDTSFLDTLWTPLVYLSSYFNKVRPETNLGYAAKCMYWIVCSSISSPSFVSVPCHFANIVLPSATAAIQLQAKEDTILL